MASGRPHRRQGPGPDAAGLQRAGWVDGASFGGRNSSLFGVLGTGGQNHGNLPSTVRVRSLALEAVRTMGLLAYTGGAFLGSILHAGPRGLQRVQPGSRVLFHWLCAPPTGCSLGGHRFPRGRFLRQEKFHSQGQCQQPVGQEEMSAHKTVGTTPPLGHQAHPPPTQCRKRWPLGTLQAVGLPTGGRHTQDRCLAREVSPLMFVISDPVCWATGIDWLASPESKAERGFSLNLLLPDPPRPREFGSTEHWALG